MARVSPGDVWQQFEHDPRTPAVASLRASDRDRDIALGVLAEAYAEGRLDRAEYDDRSASVQSSRTLGDLPPLLTDLVPTSSLPALRTSTDLHQQAVERYRHERRQAVWGMLSASIICWVIWIALGADGFVWPAIVTAGTGVNVVRMLFMRSEIIRENERSLQRKQEKQLRKLQPPPSDD